MYWVPWMRTYSSSLLSDVDMAHKLTFWSHQPPCAWFQESCGMLPRSPLGWHGWWRASLRPQSFPSYGCLPCGKRTRSHSTSSSGTGSSFVPRAAPANIQHGHRQTRRGHQHVCNQCHFPRQQAVLGVLCAKLEFSAAPFRRECFWQACYGTRAPGQLGREASRVNEVFCAVFQMTVEVRSKVSRVNTAR